MAVETGVLAAAVLIGRLLGLHPLATWTPAPGALALGVAATLPLLGALALILGSGWRVWRELVAAVERAAGPLVRGLRPWQILLLSALAGVGEEALFRGVAQQALARVAGRGPALLIAALAFGGAHAVTTTYAIVAAAMGLYLGWLFDWSGTLAVPAVAHAAYDAVALFIFRRRIGRAPSAATPHL